MKRKGGTIGKQVKWFKQNQYNYFLCNGMKRKGGTIGKQVKWFKQNQYNRLAPQLAD